MQISITIDLPDNAEAVEVSYVFGIAVKQAERSLLQYGNLKVDEERNLPIHTGVIVVKSASVFRVE